MSYRRVQIGSLFVLSMVATALIASGVPALTGPTTIAPLVDQVKDAVVNITAVRSGNTDFLEDVGNPGRPEQLDLG